MMILLIINQKKYHQANNQKKKNEKINESILEIFQKMKKMKKEIM